MRGEPRTCFKMVTISIVQYSITIFQCSIVFCIMRGYFIVCCIVYTVYTYSIPYSVYCIAYSVYCVHVQYTVQYTVQYAVQYTVQYTIYCIPYSVYTIRYTVRVHSIHYTAYNKISSHYTKDNRALKYSYRILNNGYGDHFKTCAQFSAHIYFSEQNIKVT